MLSASQPNEARQQVFIDQFSLPVDHHQLAADVCGDGHLRNQFGNIMAALQAPTLRLQDSVNIAVANHVVDYRLEIEASRPRATVFLRETSPSSRVAPNIPLPSSIHGTFDGQKFVSDNPVQTRQPVDIALSLGVLGFLVSAKIGVDAVQLRFLLEKSGKLILGQLNGTIRHTAVLDTFVPAIAFALTEWLTTHPNSSYAQEIISILQPTRDQNGRWVLTPDQIVNNPVFRNLLAPDVQMYDSQGKYSPDALGMQKDSVSFGIGFTATPVAF